jgi:hypothetical protein
LIQSENQTKTRLGDGGQFSMVELAERSMYKRIEMNWACHTRHRFCLALVVSMLFCGLTSSEIPELTRLIDDPSNDFTLVVATKTPAMVSASAVANPRVGICVGAVQQNDDRLEYREPSSSILCAQSPTGYLQLLCVHRT